MGRYGYNPRPGSAHQLALARVPHGARVLDVGCAAGYLGGRLTRAGSQAWGIDHDPEAIGQVPARDYVDSAVVDLDTAAELPWPGVDFDAVLALDVLEHLVDPPAALRLLTGRLVPGGMAIVSVPNVAHVSVRLQLARGRFDSADSGILDRTHLHLYTYDLAEELVTACGLTVTEALASSDRFGVLLNRRPALGRALRGLLAYNIVLVCRRS